MLRKNKRLAWLASIIGLLLIPVIISCSSTAPDNLGIYQNQLRNCPSSPNCVCSFQKNSPEHAIEPLAFSQSLPEVQSSIRRVLNNWPRTTIVTEKDFYTHAECRSLIMRFVDDVEILIDPKGQKIHFRSASRLGYSDLGVNRKRINQLKEAIFAELSTKN